MILKVKQQQQRRFSYHWVQAAKYGSEDEHLANLDVHGQSCEVLAQGSQFRLRQFTSPNFSEQVHCVADDLELRGV